MPRLARPNDASAAAARSPQTKAGARRAAGSTSADLPASLRMAGRAAGFDRTALLRRREPAVRQSQAAVRLGHAAIGVRSVRTVMTAPATSNSSPTLPKMRSDAEDIDQAVARIRGSWNTAFAPPTIDHFLASESDQRGGLKAVAAATVMGNFRLQPPGTDSAVSAPFHWHGSLLLGAVPVGCVTTAPASGNHRHQRFGETTRKLASTPARVRRAVPSKASLAGSLMSGSISGRPPAARSPDLVGNSSFRRKDDVASTSDGAIHH